MKDLNELTYRAFKRVPLRKKWDYKVECNSIVILPGQSHRLEEVWFRVVSWFAKLLHLPLPEFWRFLSHLHDSGYRRLDFVAIKGGESICRLSGCSDVIHLDGIGGYGHDWVKKYRGVPTLIPPSGWNMDCLAKSGLLRLWPDSNRMLCSSALSSFEIFALPEKKKKK